MRPASARAVGTTLLGTAMSISASCPRARRSARTFSSRTDPRVSAAETIASTSRSLRATSARPIASAQTERPLEDTTQDGVERRRGRSEHRPYLAANLWLALQHRVEAGRDLEEV